MPINVYCTECQFTFLVGDEFAGQLGRCPECANIIQVPGEDSPAVEPEPHIDPYPYHTPRAVEAFEDFPASSRRPRGEEPPPRVQPKRDAAPREPTFDKEARAARWRSVSKGLRNMMVAVIVVAASQVLWMALLFADGVKPGQPKQWGAREKALNVGDVVVLGVGLALWGMGRIACGFVPYVPARRIARPAAIIAGMTAVNGVIALGGMLFGMIILENNLGAGIGLITLGFCALLPAMFGFVVAEVMGLLSQIRMASGLQDAGFARASRVQFMLGLFLTFLCMAGACGLTMFVGTEQNKKQQQMKQEQEAKAKQAQNAEPEKEKEKEAAPAPAEAKQKGKGKGKAAGQQEPPPEIDLDEYPLVMYGMMTGWLLVILSYTLASVICFQLGRAAIRREVEDLVGETNEHDPQNHGRH
jgi:hypothetical protein